MSVIDNFFLELEEPDKSCLLFMRQFILAQSPAFTEHWKYGLPFYYYKGKPCCYLWRHKKYNKPYLSFVDGNKMKHPDLLQEKRARMKIVLLDADKDIPLKKLKSLLKEAMLISESKKRV